MSIKRYESSDDMKFFKLKIEEDKIDTNCSMERILQYLVKILESARVKYNWEGLMREK